MILDDVYYNFQAFGSSTVALLEPIIQRITFTPTSPSSVGNLSVSASSTSGLPVTISIKSGPATIGGSAGGTLTGSGTVVLTGSGTVVLAANQAGNSIFSAASEVTATIVVNSTSGSGSGSGSGVVCFLANAPVLTPSGYRRIDSLAVGDLVQTTEGKAVAIQRIKHQRVSPCAAANPYVIPKGSYGATETLAISPRHCVVVPGRGFVEARELGLAQMPMKTVFDYSNLELPQWENMIVAGVAVESLAPIRRFVVPASAVKSFLAKKRKELPVPLYQKMVSLFRFENDCIIMPAFPKRRA